MGWTQSEVTLDGRCQWDEIQVRGQDRTGQDRIGQDRMGQIVSAEGCGGIVKVMRGRYGADMSCPEWMRLT
ncbi:hypothetical protein QFZ78_005995 [Paenibacillus sp. V4I5]|nr:hypothetical protein [Paenibacillus sp. V4I5]